MIFLSFLPPMCLGILTAISLLWMWKILQQSKQPPSTCEATFKPERIPLSAMSGAVFVKRWVGPTLTDVAYICLMQTIERVIFMWFTTHSRWCNKRALSMKYKSVTFLSSFPFSVCSIFFCPSAVFLPISSSCSRRSCALTQWYQTSSMLDLRFIVHQRKLIEKARAINSRENKALRVRSLLNEVPFIRGTENNNLRRRRIFMKLRECSNRHLQF